MATWAAVVGVGKSAEENKVAADSPNEDPSQRREDARAAPSPSNPRAAQRQRLLAEALKSRTDALTGERRCLGCARGFRDLARLAQHIADKHGGVNAVPKLDAGAPTPGVRGSLRFGEVAVLRTAPAGADVAQHLPFALAAAPTAARAPTPSHDACSELEKEKRRQPPGGAPQRAAAAAFAAPEGTHAKRRKRPSRLKRAFWRARAQEAVGHWQGTLAAIEESLQVAEEALAAARNELAYAQQQGQAAVMQQCAAHRGEWPGGVAVGVRGQLLERQVALGVEREEQLLSAHAAARQRLAEAQAQLLPPQPQLPSKLAGSIAAGPPERADVWPQESTPAATASATTQPALEHVSTRGQPAVVPGNGAASEEPAAEERESGGESSDSLPTGLGGFEDVLGRWAAQSKGRRGAPPPVGYEPNHTSSEPAATAPAPASTFAVPTPVAATAPERAHAGSDGGSSGRSSSSGSSFGLQWGDALKGWAQAVQVESHAALQAVAPRAPPAAGRTTANGHQSPLPREPKSPSVAAAGYQRAEQHMDNQPLPAQQEAAVAPALPPLAEEADEKVDAVDVGAWLEQAVAAEPPDEGAVGNAQAEAPEQCLRRSNALPAAPRQRVGGASAALPTPLLPGEQRCAACGVAVSGQRNWEEHVASLRHARRVQAVAAAAVDAEVPAPLPTTGTAAASPLPPRHAAQLPSLPGIAAGAAPYVTQTLTPELDAAAEALLRQLLEWQRRAQQADPANSRRKRRLVCGMREVHKAVKLCRAKLLVVAPNIRTAAAADGSADADGGGSGGEGEGECPIEGTLRLCQELGVPVVFALSRGRLGRVVGRRRSASAFAVLEAGGAEQRVREVLELAEGARRRWLEGRDAASPRP